MSAIQDRCGEVQPHFLASQWRWGGPPIDVHAPYDESVITRVSSAGPDEAREAVDAAAEALAGEATYVGPVINRGERDRNCERVEATRWSGATIAAGGGLRDELLEPTVIEGAPPDAKVWREEVFGPVVTLDACDSAGEGLARAYDTVHGLQAAIFTSDVAHAFNAARTLAFGAVLVNEAPTWRADPIPFGGVKESGNTREGPLVKEMTESRLVVVNPG